MRSLLYTIKRWDAREKSTKTVKLAAQEKAHGVLSNRWVSYYYIIEVIWGNPQKQ